MNILYTHHNGKGFFFRKKMPTTIFSPLICSHFLSSLLSLPLSFFFITTSTWRQRLISLFPFSCVRSASFKQFSLAPSIHFNLRIFDVHQILLYLHKYQFPTTRNLELKYAWIKIQSSLFSYHMSCWCFFQCCLRTSS